MKILFFKEGKLMSKKKKIFILVSMVLLLVVTGYLNVVLNRKNSELEPATSSANFFASVRADIVAARNYQLQIYEDVINTSTSADERADAIQKRDAISAQIAEESNLETLIAARGYEDVIVRTNGDKLNVFVKTSNGLTSDEVAAILSILVRETGVLATQVRISPVA